MDVWGLGSPQFQAGSTLIDTRGHRLEIYGSGGWGFESLRACCAKPLLMTASTLATVPIVIVFVLLRTSFLSGLSPRGTGGR